MATILGRPTTPAFDAYMASRYGRDTPFGYSGRPALSGVGSGRGSSGNGIGDGAMNVLHKAVDIASQPMYAITEYIMEMGAQDKPDSFKDWSHLGSGNSKITWSDILNGRAKDKYLEHNQLTNPNSQQRLTNFDRNTAVLKNAPGWAKGTVGFAADVLGDPLTYTGAGLVAKGVKGLTSGAGKVAAREGAESVLKTTAAKVAESPYLGRVAEKGVIGERVSAGKNHFVSEPLRARKTENLAAAGFEDLSRVRPPSVDKAAETGFFAKSYGDIQRLQSKLGKFSDELYPIGGNAGAKPITSSAVSAATNAGRTAVRNEAPGPNVAPVPGSEAPVPMPEAVPSTAPTHAAAANAPVVNRPAPPPISSDLPGMPSPLSRAEANGFKVVPAPKVEEGLGGITVRKPYYQLIDTETGEVLYTPRSLDEAAERIEKEIAARASREQSAILKERATKQVLDDGSVVDAAENIALNKSRNAGRLPVVGRGADGQPVKGTSTAAATHYAGTRNVPLAEGETLINPSGIGKAKVKREAFDDTDELVEALRKDLFEFGPDPAGPREIPGEIYANFSGFNNSDLAESARMAITDLTGRSTKNLQVRDLTALLTDAIEKQGVSAVRKAFKSYMVDSAGEKLLKAALREGAEPSDIMAALRQFKVPREAILVRGTTNKVNPSKVQAILRDHYDKLVAQNKRAKQAITLNINATKPTMGEIPEGWFRRTETGDWEAAWKDILDPEHIRALLNFTEYDEFVAVARSMGQNSKRNFNAKYNEVYGKRFGELTTYASGRITAVEKLAMATGSDGTSAKLVDLISNAIRTGDSFEFEGVTYQLNYRLHVGEDMRPKRVKAAEATQKQLADDVKTALKAQDEVTPNAALDDVIENSTDIAEEYKLLTSNDEYHAAVTAKREFYRSGQGLSDEQADMIYEAVTSQAPKSVEGSWLGETGNTRAAKQFIDDASGWARHENAWNLHAQTRTAELSLKRHSDEWLAQNGKEIDWTGEGDYWNARAQYMLDNVTEDLIAADRFFMAQGTHLFPHLAEGYKGAPLGLGQLLQIIRDSPKGLGGTGGETFLKEFVFRPLNKKNFGRMAGGGKKAEFVKQLKVGDTIVRHGGANFLVGIQQLGEIAGHLVNIARKRMPNGTMPPGPLTEETLRLLTEAWQEVNSTLFRSADELAALGEDEGLIQKALFRQTKTGAVEGLPNKLGPGKSTPFNALDPFDMPERSYREVQWFFEHPYFVGAVVDRVNKNAANIGLNFADDVGDMAGELLRPAAEALETRLSPLFQLTDGKTVIDDTIDNGAKGFFGLGKGKKGFDDLGKNRHPKVVDKITDPAVPPAAARMAKNQLDSMITDPAQGASIASVSRQGGKNAIKREATQKSVNAQNHIAQQESNAFANVVRDQFKAAAEKANYTIDPADLIEIGMQGRIFSMLDAGLRHLNKSYGDALIHEAHQMAGNASSVLQRTFRRDMNQFYRDVAPLAQAAGKTNVEYVAGIFKHLQRSKPGEVLRGATDAETKVMRKMEDLTNQIFSSNEDSLLGVWTREGFDVNALNDRLKQINPDWEINLNQFSAKRKVTTYADDGTKVTKRIPTFKDLDNVWRSWEVNDPFEFLSQMQNLTVNMATNVGTAREFFELATKANMLAMKPRDGWVRVGRKLAYGDVKVGGKSARSTIAAHLPMNGRGEVFMDPDLFMQMKRMDTMISQMDFDAISRKQLTKMYDEVISIFKSGMTIWRPSHHVRNLIGDTTLAWFASGVKNPVYYYKSLRISQNVKLLREAGVEGNFRHQYTAWDSLNALHGLRKSIDDLPKGFRTQVQGTLLQDTVTEPITFIRNGSGVKRELTPNEVARLAMRNGILPDFNVQEDIIKSSARAGKVSIRQPLGGRGRERLGNFVEGRDDFVRLAHFTHLLENGINNKGWKRGMTNEDIVRAAAAQVRKVHPDGSDLTPFERKTMRRVFTFYSWIRKAIPLVVENTLKHPGRAMAYPKALYNFGIAAGVDLESLSEPFPDDQMFPEFVSDPILGFLPRTKDGDYYTFSLGVANIDVANDWFAGTQGGGVYDKPGPMDDIADLLMGFGKEALGMTTPAVQLPVTLLTGRDPDSGIAVNDKLEALENSIPGLGDIARISGYSPLGTLAGQGGIGKVDPLAQVTKGNRDAIGGEPGWSPEYLANYFLGARLTNVSKPSYQNIAELEKRDRAAAQKRDNAR